MLRNCVKCNQLFSHPTQRLCNNCYRERQENFAKVKDYLREHPKSSLAEVSAATEVSLEEIKEFIREGRLTIVPADVQLTCEVCGAEIKKGKLCAKCSSELKGIAPPEETPETNETRQHGRVHLLDKLRDRDHS